MLPLDHKRVAWLLADCLKATGDDFPMDIAAALAKNADLIRSAIAFHHGAAEPPERLTGEGLEH